MNSFHKNNKGFTLIEIMAVLVIMGVIISVGMHKINFITDSAEKRALETGVAELNAREMLYWTNAKFAPGGWTGNGGDTFVWTTMMVMNTDLGNQYSWTPNPPVVGGATLRFGSQSITLTRAPSTNTKAARW